MKVRDITMTLDEMITYDRIVDLGIATAEELNLVNYITEGGWKDTFDAVMWVRTGYRSFEQYMECEGNEG